MIDVANPEGEYNGEQINRYKIENIDDPFLLNISDNKTWVDWLDKGIFPEESLNK
jgi:hypothetical protein